MKFASFHHNNHSNSNLVYDHKYSAVRIPMSHQMSMHVHVIYHIRLGKTNISKDGCKLLFQNHVTLICKSLSDTWRWQRPHQHWPFPHRLKSWMANLAKNHTFQELFQFQNTLVTSQFTLPKKNHQWIFTHLYYATKLFCLKSILSGRYQNKSAWNRPHHQNITFWSIT